MNELFILVQKVWEVSPVPSSDAKRRNYTSSTDFMHKRRGSIASAHSSQSDLGEESNYSSDDNAFAFLLDMIGDVLNEHPANANLVSFDLIQFLLRIKLRSNDDGTQVFSIGKVLSLITSNTDRFNDDICYFLCQYWKTLDDSINTNPYSYISFLKRLRYIQFHPCKSTVDYLALIWKKCTFTERSYVRTDICLALDILLSKTAYHHSSSSDLLQSNTIKNEWKQLFVSESDINLQELLENIFDTSLKWIKKEKWGLILACFSLSKTSLTLSSSASSFFRKLDSWLECLLKVVRLDKIPERLELFKTFQSMMFLCPEDFFKSDPSLFCKLGFSFLSALFNNIAKKRLNFSDQDVTYLVRGFQRMFSVIDDPELIFQFSTALYLGEKASPEQKSFVLRLLKYCPGYLKRHLPSELKSGIVNIIETLKDRYLLKDALILMPFIEIDDSRKSLEYLQVSEGLLRSKYGDISEAAFQSVRHFADSEYMETVLVNLVEQVKRIFERRTRSSSETIDEEQKTQITERSDFNRPIDSKVMKYLQLITDVLHDCNSKSESIVQRRLPRFTEIRCDLEYLMILALIQPANQSIREKFFQILEAVRKLKVKELDDDKKEHMIDSVEFYLNEEPLWNFSIGLSDWEIEFDERIKTSFNNQIFRMINEKWDIHHYVLLRAWRELYLEWEIFEKSMILQSNESYASINASLNVIFFMCICVQKKSDEVTGSSLSVLEVSKFFQDCSQSLFTSCRSRLHLCIPNLPTFAQCLIWGLSKLRTESKLFEQIFICFNNSKEELDLSYHEDQSKKKQSSNSDVQDTNPDSPATPFIVYLLYCFLSKPKLNNMAEIIRQHSFLFQILFRFFKFWLNNDNYNVFFKKLVNASTFDILEIIKQVAAVFEKFILLTDGYACERLFEPKLSTNLGSELSKELTESEFLLGITRFFPSILSFLDRFVLKPVSFNYDNIPDQERMTKIQQELQIQSVLILDSSLKCGAIPTDMKVVATNGSNSNLRVVIHFQLMNMLTKGDYITQPVQQALNSLLCWNSDLYPLYLKSSYRGFDAPEDLRALEESKRTRLNYISKVVHLQAFADNLKKHSDRWVLLIGRSTLMMICLLYQCNENVAMRYLSISIVEALLRSSSNSSPGSLEVAETLPSASSVEKYLYWEKAYQFSGVLSLLFPNETANFIAAFANNLRSYDRQDRFHLINCLPVWGSLIKGVIKKNHDDEILSKLLELSEICGADIGMKKSLDSIWKSIFKDSYGDEILLSNVVCFLVQKMTILRTQNDFVRARNIRDIFTFLISSKKSYPIIDLLMNQFDLFRKIESTDLRKLNLRINTTLLPYKPEEESVFIILTDIAFRYPDLLISYLMKLLHLSLVVFGAVPFFPKDQTVGNLMLWYLFEYLALNSATNVEELKDLAKWQRSHIPPPFKKDSFVAPEMESNYGYTKSVIQKICSVFARNSENLWQEWTEMAYRNIYDSGNLALSCRSCLVYLMLHKERESKVKSVAKIIYNLLEARKYSLLSQVVRILEFEIREFANDTETKDSELEYLFDIGIGCVAYALSAGLLYFEKGLSIFGFGCSILSLLISLTSKNIIGSLQIWLESELPLSEVVLSSYTFLYGYGSIESNHKETSSWMTTSLPIESGEWLVKVAAISARSKNAEIENNPYFACSFLWFAYNFWLSYIEKREFSLINEKVKLERMSENLEAVSEWIEQLSSSDSSYKVKLAGLVAGLNELQVITDNLLKFIQYGVPTDSKNSHIGESISRLFKELKFLWNNTNLVKYCLRQLSAWFYAFDEEREETAVLLIVLICENLNTDYTFSTEEANILSSILDLFTRSKLEVVEDRQKKSASAISIRATITEDDNIRLNSKKSAIPVSPRLNTPLSAKISMKKSPYTSSLASPISARPEFSRQESDLFKLLTVSAVDNEAKSLKNRLHKCILKHGEASFVDGMAMKYQKIYFDQGYDVQAEKLKILNEIKTIQKSGNREEIILKKMLETFCNK